jgi:hypothetical protein
VLLMQGDLPIATMVCFPPYRMHSVLAVLHLTMHIYIYIYKNFFLQIYLDC